MDDRRTLNLLSDLAYAFKHQPLRAALMATHDCWGELDEGLREQVRA